MTKRKSIPIAKNEDVEFSRDLADRNDFEALRRAHRADRRQEKKK
ncbi:YfhD family protein [Caldalkalibacillus mannanilyticus]|nr:YfhD family protein [Caldalkalibacillus mannanilyticus]